MQRLREKLLYCLAARHSSEEWGFQRQAKEHIQLTQPRTVVVTGILPFHISIFHTNREDGRRITDLPHIRALESDLSAQQLSVQHESQRAYFQRKAISL